MIFPDFRYEKELWGRGFRLVAGCDEVGRGCFAGPVVAACVIFPSNFFGEKLNGVKINDSKKLTPKEREKTSFWIRKYAAGYGIGKASVNEINKFGIKKASEIAFRRSIRNFGKRIEFLLIDAFYIPYVKNLRRKNQLAIVKGDSKSFSIAAASVVAKVYRDKLMRQLSASIKYKKYGWGENKGYGTRLHREAIVKYGTTVYHRTQFVETYLSKREN